MKFDTLQVHAGQSPKTDKLCTAVPIYQTNAYEFLSADHANDLFSLKEAGNIYTRITNPTVSIFEDRINALENGMGALAFSSGHSAIFLSILNLCEAGDEIVSSNKIYGGTYTMFTHTLKSIGINVKMADPDNIENFSDAITDKTKAIFIETIGNPNANLCDIEEISKIASKNKIPLIVDSTFTTPYLLKPFEYGANIVIHSATKYIGGHGTTMGGVVIDGGNFDYDNGKFPLLSNPDPSYHGINYVKDCGKIGFLIRLRVKLLRDLGPCLSPFNAFMLIQGVQTLSLRMERHSQNGLAVAQFLEKHPMVKSVSYPGLKSSKYYNLTKKYLSKGQGGIMSFELDAGIDECKKFIDSLKLFLNVANVGDARSLVIHPASTTHSQLSDDSLKTAGISKGTIRLSVGIEDISDILEDLDNAIKAI